MKNKEYLKNYLIQIFITMIIFLTFFFFINTIQDKEYKKNFNYKISAILEVILEKYPDTRKDELISILNSSNNIDKEYFIEKNNQVNIKYNFIKVLILLLMNIVIIYIFVKSHLKSDREINKIIKCIENINHKNYELDINELSEDKLSILKQEIYKTSIMLKENADNSLRDKINLKNSLQDISHQLKTPLTSINIMLDNIIDNPDMDIRIRQDFIMQIKREINNITFLVSSILKLSKFEANTIIFNRKDVSIMKIINDAIKNVSNLCDLKNVNIKINNSCKNKIYCDYKWQVEAITNILKNAIEYSYEGNDVIIECDDNNLYTEIKIKDFGKGMDEEDTLNIFRRFYKGKNANNDSVGIGLSLSKKIIEKDNGIIVVESSKEIGTTFIIKYMY